MLDVDSYRRPYHNTGYGSHTPQHDCLTAPSYSALSLVNKQESHTLHWPQGPSPIPATAAGPELRSDEEDDEDYRPFTPPPPRERLSYTRYQLEMLNGIYARVKYPNSTQKQLIAKRVGITREQVKIWFQNRRRKDVVGKKKDGSESDSSKGDQSDNKSDNGDSDSGVSEDQDKVMVPDVVMKSVIAELNKFEKDQLKSTKVKKRMKASQRKKVSKARAQQLPNLLLASGGYDMISPPNQVTPTAVLTRPTANRFNHSKDMSAFESPRECSRLSSYNDPYGPHNTNPLMPNSQRLLSALEGMNGVVGGTNGTSQSIGCDIPVLSDLLSYTKTNSRSNDARTNDSTFQQHSGQDSYYTNREGHLGHSPLSNHNAAALGRVYPFPFFADPPFLLTALRHAETYRPHVPYSAGHQISEGHSHFQPYSIASLTNPYYNSPSTSLPWTSHTVSDNNTSYAHL